MPLLDAPLAIVDLETTGVHPAHDRVTEIAVLEVDGGKVSAEWSTLVNPQTAIPAAIQALTGITNEMVAGAPTFRSLAGELHERLDGRVFVAHNARFDFGFLDAEFSRVAPTPLGALVTAQLCTVRLARRLLAHLPRRNLDAVSAHYGVSITDRHRASGDALATAAVLRGLLRDASLRGVHTWGELDALLARGTARKQRSALPRSSEGADGV